MKKQKTTRSWLGLGTLGSVAACAACCAAPAVLLAVGATGLAASVSAALVWLEPTFLVVILLFFAAMLYRHRRSRARQSEGGGSTPGCGVSCETPGVEGRGDQGCGCASS